MKKENWKQIFQIVLTIAKRLQRYKKKSNNHTIPYYNCMKSFTYLQF